MRKLIARLLKLRAEFRVRFDLTCFGLVSGAFILAFSVNAFALQPAALARAELNPDWGHFQDLAAPGSKLTRLTYQSLFDSYLQDLAAYPDFYLRFLAKTSISIEERRLAFDEFISWWAVEDAVQKAYGEQPLRSESLLKLYFDDARRSRLSRAEAKRVRFLEVMLTQGFSDSTRFALTQIQKSESREDGVGRLTEFAAALGVLMGDERCLSVVANLTNALYDISEDDSVAVRVQEHIHDIAVGVMAQLDHAAKNSEGIDILAPENLLGGAALARAAAPWIFRTLSGRFLRASWHASTVMQKAGSLALIASPIAVGSLRKHKARPASEVTLFHRTSDLAGEMNREALKVRFQDP